MSKPIVFALVGDVHCNSTVAVIPPEGVRLDDGGRYLPSKPQRWLWDCWTDFWGKVGALRDQLDAQLRVAVNGDLVEGKHHDSTQIASLSSEDEFYIARRVYGTILDQRPARVFVTRGTRAHARRLGNHEELIANDILHAETCPETGKHSAWRWTIEANGRVFDMQHHPGTRGKLPWTQPQGVNRLAFLIWSEHGLAGSRPPDIAVRSHNHRYGDSFKAYPTRALCLPAWQLKTDFAHQVASESVISDIGGVIVVVYPDGRYDVREELYKPALPKPWREPDAA